jgi:type II secretory pathway pseudopilin PulG
METLVVLLVVGAVIAFVVSRAQNRKQQAELESVQAVRSVAEEDVTRLGEDVALLDTETAGRELDEATRQDYRRALDAYDAAKSAVGRVRSPQDVKAITGILEDGRYAIACVQARLAGRPLPQRRPPCFFNPQHGPSTEDVEWAPSGGQPRPVPVCAADAERVRAGAEPDIRQVPVGAGRRPYWQGGPGYGPYAQGYFSPYAGSGLLPGVLLGAVMFGGFGGWDGDGSDGGGDGGDSGGDSDGGGDYGDGGDAGGDGGGDMDGGGDFAGGDWGGGGFDGGGDFGGGDFGGF